MHHDSVIQGYEKYDAVEVDLKSETEGMMKFSKMNEDCVLVPD